MTSAVMTFKPKVVGTCSIHGEQTDSVLVQTGGPYDGRYCIACYVSFVIQPRCERLIAKTEGGS